MSLNYIKKLNIELGLRDPLGFGDWRREIYRVKHGRVLRDGEVIRVC